MTLLLDFGANWLRFGALDVKGVRWVETAAGTSAYHGLQRALAAFGLNRRRPDSIGVVQFTQRDGEPHVSWSTVRAAVAMGNTLAFAWNTPVFGVKLTGEETEAGIADKCRLAAGQAEPGRWAGALYDGEPNITRSTKRL